MQPQEIDVSTAADYVLKYMKNEEHIQRLVTKKAGGKSGTAENQAFGEILKAAVQRLEKN